MSDTATAFRANIAATVARYGEDISLRYAAGGTTGPLRASVQAAIGIDTVNDYQQDGMLIYLPAAVLVTPPAKMDRIVVRGIDRTIDEVRVERMDGLPLCWILVIR